MNTNTLIQLVLQGMYVVPAVEDTKKLQVVPQVMELLMADALLR